MRSNHLKGTTASFLIKIEMRIKDKQLKELESPIPLVALAYDYISRVELSVVIIQNSTFFSKGMDGIEC